MTLTLTACTNQENTTEPPTTKSPDDGESNDTLDDQPIDECDEERPNMILTFCDNFNSNGENVNEFGIDEDKWAYQLGTGSQYGLTGWGNNEEQYYREENITTHDGNLIIEAKPNDRGYRYTSGRLYTNPTFTQTYGRFEASIKLSTGDGFWPAFWMMPKDSVYGGWAASGEIDIMEAKGRFPNESSGAIHFGDSWPNNTYKHVSYQFPVGEDITDFHQYAVEWEPGEIRWYVDGHLISTINDWYSKDNPFPAPFDQDFYLILNLAVGGAFDGGRTPDATDFPAKMEVEYVRAWQFDYSNDTDVPSEVSNLALRSPYVPIIEWDNATDNMSIKEYEVYLDDVLVGTTITTDYTFTDLISNTEYTIKVIAVDRGGNRSNGVNYTFKVNYPTVGMKIEAEHYIAMSGIDLEPTNDIGDGENVGWIDMDDYMTYIIYVQEAGTYQVNYRVASNGTGGRISLYDGNQIVTETAVAGTGGWQVWTTVQSESFTLTEGVHTIQLLANPGGFNINWLEIIEN